MRPFRALKAALRSWWVWTDRPPSLRAMWRLSDFNADAVFKGSEGLASAWRAMNVTERLLAFVLVVAAPGFLQPVLRWVFVSPARRGGFWLVGIVLAGWQLIARVVT